MKIEMMESSEFNPETQIRVIGVGGGGGNAVEHMINSGVRGVEFICANTDAQALKVSSAHRVIQLGDNGLGAGSKPERGQAAAEAAIDNIREVLQGANMVLSPRAWAAGPEPAQRLWWRVSPATWVSSPWVWSPSLSTGKADDA